MERASRRLSYALLAIVGAFWLTSGLYGIASPFIFGHYGYHGGEYSTRARHTLRHGTFLPSNVPCAFPPPRESYYLHHPVLTHHLVTLTMALLGENEYAVRAGGLLASTAALAFLVLLVWRRWGPWQAVLAAAIYTLVPVDVWFANHMDPGFPSIACLLGFFLAYLRWLDDGRWRWGGLALLGMFMAGGFEWSPYLAALPIGLHVLAVGIWRGGRYLGFVPLYLLSVLVPLGVHFLIIYKTGHWAEFVSSYHIRTAGPEGKAFAQIMYGHALTMLGPLLWVVAAWVILLIVRLAMGRLRARDLVGVAFLFAQLAYMPIFRGAIITHHYRFLYSGVVCALAVVDLAEAAAALAGWALPRRATVARVLAGGAVGLAVCALAIKPAWAALLESRLHGGIPEWGHYEPDSAKIAFAEMVRDATRPTDLLLIHRTLSYRMELVYYLDREQPHLPSLGRALSLPKEQLARALVLCVPAGLGADERRTLNELLRAHPSHQVDRYLMIDLRTTGPHIVIDRVFPPQRRTAAALYWVGPWPRLLRAEDKPREIDAMLDLKIKPPPDAPTLDLPAPRAWGALVQYHNYSVLRGDAKQVDQARQRIALDLNARGPRPLSPDAEVMGFVLPRRAPLQVFLRALRPGTRTATLRVQTRELATGRLRRHDHPVRPPPPDWFPGFLYADTQPLDLPPGRYEVAVALTGDPPPPVPPPAPPPRLRWQLAIRLPGWPRGYVRPLGQPGPPPPPPVPALPPMPPPALVGTVAAE
ncbi:MAG TPA: glycosyltransferase family 39 protein [Polyangia bacterium]|nr:glycosyltransferase family 39 protein [Polyangia bacterium]